jgi:hypothetical protein
MQWATKITDLLFDSMVATTNDICSKTLGDRFHRFDPILHSDIPMDDPNLTSAIATRANEVDIDPMIEWIENVFLKPQK